MIEQVKLKHKKYHIKDQVIIKEVWIVLEETHLFISMDAVKFKEIVVHVTAITIVSYKVAVVLKIFVVTIAKETC